MSAIFISYRRDDTEGQAGRLFQGLREQFGAQAVFMDVSGIDPGRDFRKVIDANVAQCGVLLALIGRQWLTAVDAQGQRRIDSPQDFVRLETASALRREIPVVPVLVQGAQMPRADQLPPDLADLAYRNAVELTHARWDSDLQVLVGALRRLVGPDTPAPPGASPRPADPPARQSPPAVAAVPAAPQPPAGPPPARGKGLLVGGVLSAAALLAGGAWVVQDRKEQEQQAQALAQARQEAASAAAQLAQSTRDKEQRALADARAADQKASDARAAAAKAAEIKAAEIKATETKAAETRPTEARPVATRPQADAGGSQAAHDTPDARRMTEVVVGDGRGNRLGTYQRAADGSWGEHDLAGRRVFVFRELSRDVAKVDLWDDSRQVGVQLDVPGRAVNYRGSSQEPYRLLYRMLSAR